MRKLSLPIVLVALAACNGSEIVNPGVTTTVVVTPSATQIVVGETALASAAVRDQNGEWLTGRTVAWTSLNASVATVTSAGVIRGVTPGTATIQGRVDGVTGDVTIRVVAPANVCEEGPTSLSLAPGEVRVLNVFDSEGCVRVMSAATQSRYVVIAANTNAVPDALPNFVLRSELNDNTPSGTLLATPSRIVASLSVSPASPMLDLQSSFETGIRRIERRLDLPKAQSAYADGSLARGLRYSVTSAAIAAVGEKVQFKVPKSCSDFKTITATARRVSTRAIIFTDDAAPSGGFSDTELQEIASEFDTLIYPTNVEYFGTPLDLDENSRIIILYTPEVNRLTPAGNPDSFVGGFFFAGDLFPASSCAQTNRAEVFYVLAPDPNGTINGNRRTTAAVRQGTRGTIAHEFQHMINASERIRHPVTTDLESVWLDEALAHFAEDLNGRVLRGLNETGNYTFEQLTNQSQQVNDYNAFFFQNFARLARYLQNPAINAPTSRLADSSLAARGAAWSLLRYAADHHAPGGDVKAFIRSLVPGPDTGVANLRAKAGNVSFDSLATAWMVANVADDAGISGLPAKYTYKTYNMRSNVARANSPNLTFPLVPAVLDATPSSAALTVRSGSGSYFTFIHPAASAPRWFRMTNADLRTAATFTGATMVVLRTQ